jgi:hypothetical protein
MNTRMWDYWRFYWPLAMLAYISLLGSQLQVMTIARYPDGVRELANIAVAGSLFTLFYSSLFFVPQLTNVFSDSAASRRKVFWFVCTGGGILTLTFASMGWTPLGPYVMDAVFPREGAELPMHDIQVYCRWFTPVLFSDGVRAYYMGLLIQNRRTGVVSVLNTASLLLTATMYYIGFQLQFDATTVAGGGQLFSSALTTMLAWVVYKRYYNQAEPENPECPTQKELWKFFYPIAITGIFFALSRPILVSFAGRTEESVRLIAACRVIFEISYFLVAPMNQFRNLYVTFGKVDLSGVLRFSIWILVGTTSAIILVLVTPLSEYLFGGFYGLQGEVKTMVIQGVWMLVPIPLVLTIRNYYHGLCMIRKTTGSMGIAGVYRVAALALVAWLLTTVGWFNQWTLAICLVLGFVVEALVVAIAIRRSDRIKV